MGSKLFPMLVLSFFIGIFAVEKTHTKDALPTDIAARADLAGQAFIAYRDAVAVYQQQHPTFTGTVSNAALAAQGSQFPASFLVVTSNVITPIGAGSGRVITCYSTLPVGGIRAALNATDNDASLGLASGGAWISAAQNASHTSTLLATPVPNGNVVSVIQVGS